MGLYLQTDRYNTAAGSAFKSAPHGSCPPAAARAGGRREGTEHVSPLAVDLHLACGGVIGMAL